MIRHSMRTDSDNAGYRGWIASSLSLSIGKLGEPAGSTRYLQTFQTCVAPGYLKGTNASQI